MDGIGNGRPSPVTPHLFRNIFIAKRKCVVIAVDVKVDFRNR